MPVAAQNVPTCEVLSFNGQAVGAGALTATTNTWTNVDITVQYTDTYKVVIYFSRTGGTGAGISIEYSETVTETNVPATFSLIKYTINELVWSSYTQGPGTFYILPYCYGSGGSTLGTTRNVAVSNGVADYLSVTTAPQVLMEEASGSFYLDYSINYRTLPTISGYTLIEPYLRTPSGNYSYLSSYIQERKAIRGAGTFLYQILYGVDKVYQDGNYTFDFVQRDSNSNVMLNTSKTFEVILKSVDSITTAPDCKYKKGPNCWLQWESSSRHTDNGVTIYLVPPGYITPRFSSSYGQRQLEFSPDGGR